MNKQQQSKCSLYGLLRIISSFQHLLQVSRGILVSAYALDVRLRYRRRGLESYRMRNLRKWLVVLASELRI